MFCHKQSNHIKTATYSVVVQRYIRFYIAWNAEKFTTTKNRKQSNQTSAYSFLCEIILKHGSNSRFTSLAGHRRNWHRWSSRLSRWARRGRPRWISRTKRRVRPTGTVPEWLLLCPNAFSATTSNAAAAATEQRSISAQSQLQGLICIQFLWIVLGWKTFTFLLY